jgi:type IV pilus assembly protein PilV
MNARAPFQLARKQRGFNMIEVLVAVVVLAIGLISVAALQVQGVRFNYGSYIRSQAVLIAEDYTERMYTNRRGAINDGLYAPFDSDTIDCSSPPAEICAAQPDTATPTECDRFELATYDQFAVSCGMPVTDGMFGGVKDLLTQGRLQVVCLDTCSDSRYQITVSWQERGTATDGTSSMQTVQYSLVVVP